MIIGILSESKQHHHSYLRSFNTSLVLLIGNDFIVPLYLADEEIYHVVYLEGDLLDTSVVLLPDYRTLQLGFGDLGAEHDEVKHQEELEEGSFGNVEVGNGLERKVSFLLLDQLIWGLLYQFHVDRRPVIGDVVALEHDQIRVLDVQLNRSDVLHHQ